MAGSKTNRSTGKEKHMGKKKSGEVVDGETGEVEMTEEEKAEFLKREAEQVDPAESTLALVGEKELVALTEAADKASEDDFQDLDADFWKPAKKGDEIRGVYGGYARGAKYLVHAILRKGKKGNAYAVRINGTAVLTRRLRQVKPGTPVLIRYMGEDKTEAGNKVNLYEVKELSLGIQPAAAP